MEATPMHQNATPDAILCDCGCGRTFVPRKRWQRFYETSCRTDFNAWRAETGVRGAVSSVRLLKRGGCSVTLRFSAVERDRVVQLEPGALVELVKP